MTHSKLKEKALKRAEVKKIYDELEVEFSILKQLLKARQEAGLTQVEIAKKMGTKAPAIARLESSLATGKHTPSISTLKKYAEALGYRLEIKLIDNFH